MKHGHHLESPEEDKITNHAHLTVQDRSCKRKRCQEYKMLKKYLFVYLIVPK